MSPESLPTAALWALCLAIGILPVVVFLLALVALDSYKLVRFRRVLTLVASGGAVALLCLVVNPLLQGWLGMELGTFARFAAPLVEELLKGAIIAAAIAGNRIGFLVDAALWGFAIGAGFAAAENVYYFRVLAQPEPAIWVIRGFGTALMHGAATSIFALTSLALSQRTDSVRPHLFLPGLALAVVLHSAFNQFLLSPSRSTAVLLLGLPVLFALVFRASENATHRWLGVGFDSDQELLSIINDGKVSETRVGRYLRQLTERFPGPTVVDMLCLIRLQLELSLRAKGVLLMQKAGFTVPPDPELEERFQELAFLEKSIGTTGLLALKPIFSLSRRDLWQVHVLGSR